MRVISARPYAPSKKNLLENGSFENYYAGAPQPQHVLSAPDGKGDRSSIERSSDASDGSMAVKQAWTSRDWGISLDACFTLEAVVRKESTYLVAVDAKVLTEGTAYLAVYLGDDAGTYVPADALEISSGEAYATFSASVQTDEYSRIRLVSRGPNPLKEYPCEVLWDNWRVAPVTEPEDTVFRYDPPEAGKDNLIANGSFEQWVPGEAAPAGFGVNLLRDAGLVLMQDARGAEATHTVEEYWPRSDKVENPFNVFHTVVTGLQAHTYYELSIKLDTLGSATTRAIVYAQGADGEPAGALASQVFPPKDGYTEYTLRFKTESEQQVIIAVKGPIDDGAYPTRALWDDWRLVEVKNGE
ncbi:MAG: hypothetical protein ACLFTT_06250 [Candidatus Hydrogenedentota bacterium]